MTNWYKSFSIAMMAGLLSSQISQAQTDAPTSSPANPTEEQTSPVAPEDNPPVHPTTPRDVSCPPGQFPSAFSDVPPDHWAYEAVIQLASPSIECFPNTSEQ